jgi:hypothetical protein
MSHMAAQSNRAKPLVSAFLCEKVLTEKDGVQSYVRVVDRFTVPRLPDSSEARVLVWLAIIVKSGKAKGKYNLSLRMNTPTGEVKAIGEETPFALNGGEHGVNANLMLALQVSHEGLFGIDVMVDGDVLTQVPFRVILVAADPQTTEQSTPSEPGPHSAV